jgi:hypothetical protein
MNKWKEAVKKELDIQIYIFLLRDSVLFFFNIFLSVQRSDIFVKNA